MADRMDIYDGRDPLEIAIYTYRDASHFLNIPQTTIRYWARGGFVTNDEGRHHFQPVIAARGAKGLSFKNLIELYVLKALRRIHRISLENIRQALLFAEEELRIERLLLRDLMTYGPDVFVHYYGEVVNLNRGGQIALRELIESYMKRVERDENDIPYRLYPIVQGSSVEKPVSVDPRVSFGRPTIYGTGVATAVIAERIDAGEDIEEVAVDYHLPPQLISDANLYEHSAPWR
jgi:uncharacterized protein (DUF433 family)